MKKTCLTIICLSVGVSAWAQGREDFLRQQAYAEMQRVVGQIDVLQNNFESLQGRVSRLEGGNDTRSLQAEIDALKASVAELRRDLSAQRDKIVRDLSGRLAKLQPAPEKAAPAPKPAVPAGPHKEYVVESGDTLSLISQAFGTTVPKLKELNGLKSDALRVGQKLIVPMEKK